MLSCIDSDNDNMPKVTWFENIKMKQMINMLGNAVS